MNNAPSAAELLGGSGPLPLAPPASDLLEETTTTTSITASSVPTGAVSLYIATTPPTGWLKCDGSAVSRTTYSTLFGIIGTAYGVGDGSTTFNLPDMQGRVPVGVGVHADVSTLANNDGQAAANRRPKHRTSLTDPGHIHYINQVGGAGATNGVSNAAFGSLDPTVVQSSTTGVTVGSGVANDALDAPSYIVMAFIIKT